MLRTRLALLAVLFASPAVAAEPVRVTNLDDGAVLRYPLALLRGRLDDTAADIVCVNQSSGRPSRTIKGVADRGRFVVLAELLPGDNRLLLRAGAQELPFVLTYKPQTNPYFVRVVWMTDAGGGTAYESPLENDPQDYENKLDTGLKLMQCFTAERMNDLGFGRVTFNLEFDDRGRVRVHTVKGDLPAESYYRMDEQAWYRHVDELVRRRFPGDRTKNLVLAAYTRFDPQTGKVRGHTALGGGQLALFGSGGLFAWPSTPADVAAAFADTHPVDGKAVFDDSAFRGTFWGVAATTLGSALHELGHTFDLPHSREPLDVMTRGFDRFNRAFTLVEPPSRLNRQPLRFAEREVACFAPVSAAYLKGSRWFALDERPYRDAGRPSVRLDDDSGELVVEADNGVRYIGLDVRGEAVDFRAYWDREPPKEVRFREADLTPRAKTTDVRLRVLDDQGLSRSVEAGPLLERRKKDVPLPGHAEEPVAPSLTPTTSQTSRTPRPFSSTRRGASPRKTKRSRTRA